MKIEENSLNRANKSTDEGAARLLLYIAPGRSSLCVHFDPFRIASRWDGRSAAAFLPPYLNSLIPNYETYRDAGSRTFGARFKRERGGPVGLNERKTSNATYSRGRGTSFPFFPGVHYLEYRCVRKCGLSLKNLSFRSFIRSVIRAFQKHYLSSSLRAAENNCLLVLRQISLSANLPSSLPYIVPRFS